MSATFQTCEVRFKLRPLEARSFLALATGPQACAAPERIAQPESRGFKREAHFRWGVQRAAESSSPADEIRIRQHRSAAEVPTRPEAAIASGVSRRAWLAAERRQTRLLRNVAEAPARPPRSIAAIASGTAADTRRSVELKVNGGCKRDVWAE
jgi:hypothetical protein